MYRWLPASALALSVAGCRPFPAQRQPALLAHSLQELAATHRHLTTSLASGSFVDATSEVMAPWGFLPAALLSAGDAGRGPAGTRAFLERDSLNATSRGYMTVVRIDVSADGNDGYSYGYLDVARANGDTLFGSYKSYWRRGSDGAWKALVIARGRREHGGPDVAAQRRFSGGPYRRWPAEDSSAAREILRKTEAAFSDSSRSSIALAFKAFAASDAARISGPSYVFGPEAVARDFLTPAPPGFTGMTWSAEHGTVSAAGDLGFNAGRVFSRPGPAGAAPQAGGMFVTVWRRQANGEWKYLVD